MCINASMLAHYEEEEERTLEVYIRCIYLMHVYKCQ